MAEAEIFLVDSGTTNTILRETKYFQTLTKKNGNMMTIAGSNAHIVGTGSATLVLPWVLKNMWWIYSLHRHQACTTCTYIPLRDMLQSKPYYFRKIWHDRLGHPELGMMRRIINNSAGHRDFPNLEDFYLHRMCKREASHLSIRPED